MCAGGRGRGERERERGTIRDTQAKETKTQELAIGKYSCGIDVAQDLAQLHKSTDAMTKLSWQNER